MGLKKPEVKIFLVSCLVPLWAGAQCQLDCFLNGTQTWSPNFEVQLTRASYKTKQQVTGPPQAKSFSCWSQAMECRQLEIRVKLNFVQKSQAQKFGIYKYKLIQKCSFLDLEVGFFFEFTSVIFEFTSVIFGYTSVSVNQCNFRIYFIEHRFFQK